MGRKFGFGRYFWRVAAYIFVVAGALIIILPFVWMLVTSLKTPAQVFRWPPEFIPNPLSIEGYKNIFSVYNIPRYFFNSVFVSTTATLGSVFICTMAGYAFAHLKFPYKNFWFILILISLMLPFQVRMITTFKLLNSFGWLNSYEGLIIPWWATAIGIFLMRQMATAIPRSILESAKIDGCSEFKIFWIIAVPLVKPGIFALGIITFIAMWNELLWPLVVITNEEMKTLPLFIANIAGGTMELTTMPWPSRMAAVSIVILPVLIVYIFIQKYIMKALSLYSGIK